MRFKNIYFFFYLAFSHKTNFSTHQKLIHATQKDWACDCCGSRYGTKHALKIHMITHLPPSFACPKSPKKFVLASNFKTHLKRHAGILNEACKICNKAYSYKTGLTNHIVSQHFSKLHCEVPNCSYKCATKSHLKRHLKNVHQKVSPSLIKKLIEKIDKLKPNFLMMKHA